MLVAEKCVLAALECVANGVGGEKWTAWRRSKGPGGATLFTGMGDVTRATVVFAGNVLEEASHGVSGYKPNRLKTAAWVSGSVFVSA